MNPLLLRGVLALGGIGTVGAGGYSVLPPAPIEAAQKCEREGGISLRWRQAVAGQPYQASLFHNHRPIPEMFAVKADASPAALQSIANVYCGGDTAYGAAQQNLERARAAARRWRVALD